VSTGTGASVDGAAPSAGAVADGGAATQQQVSQADKFLGGILGTRCAPRNLVSTKHSPDDEHPRANEVACDLMTPPTPILTALRHDIQQL
jgi:hypothetical protein